MRRAVLLCVWFAFAACAQVGSDSVVASSSRSVTVIPDQVRLAVSVVLPLNQGLSDALALVGGAGVQATDLASVAGTGDVATWGFLLTVPIDALQQTRQMLNAVSGPVSWSMLTSVVSNQARLAACPVEDLLADARAQAVGTAAVHGGQVGAVLAMERFAPISSAGLSLLIGDFSIQSIHWFDSFRVYVAAPVQCGLRVRFAVN